MAILSAFCGAFFAFLFIRLADITKTLHDGTKLNYVTLVNVEYYLNKCMSDLSDNIYEIDQINIFFQKAKESQKTCVVSNWPQTIELNYKLVEGLTNIDLINDLFAYLDRLKKINRSIERLNQFYSEFRGALFQKNIEKETYRHNFETYVLKQNELKNFIVDLKNDSIRLLAIVRIITNKSMPIFDRCYQFFYKKKYQKDFNEKVNEETAIIRNELEDSKKQSLDEINRALGNK